jgi:putative membrane protein
VEGGMAFPSPANIWTSWNLNPVALLLIALVAALYCCGFVRLWHRRNVARAIRVWQAVAFLTGILLLLVTLVSPLDRLTLALLWVHMVQYMLLTIPVALLLALGRPVATMRWALAPTRARQLLRWRSRSRAIALLVGFITRPAVIGLLDVGALLAWHIPALQQATLTNEALHLLEQASFLAAGLLFWWMIRHPQARPTMGYARVLFCDIGASLIGVFFGMALFGTAGPWYPQYAARSAVWGMSGHADQQLAGLIVGALPEVFDFIPVIYIVARWINWSDA